MRRIMNALGFATVAATVLAFAAPASAQVVVVPSAPVYAPQRVVTYYGAPTVTYSAPVTYAVPGVSYYSAPVVTYASPVVTTYSAPVVSYAAPVTTYAAPVTTYYASPGVYTTYTYRYGAGIFRPRYVTQSYYTPLR